MNRAQIVSELQQAIVVEKDFPVIQIGTDLRDAIMQKLAVQRVGVAEIAQDAARDLVAEIWDNPSAQTVEREDMIERHIRRAIERDREERSAAMIRVYTASKLRHAAMWRQLCAETKHVQFHARWLKHNVIGTPDDAVNASEFWLQDEQDVRDADAMLVYAEDGEHLRGALVEAGIAIACGIIVFVVGNHPDFGTWQYHPGVVRVPTLAAALEYLSKLTPRYRWIERQR